ncbi:recombinase family protein [Lysinibacillus sp. NPDC093190]|uniref:recombinase family protein n=1 Tax=Lysinibacillus sp. NPDC093190 TaxID=3390575 RepID=UPI003D089966
MHQEEEAKVYRMIEDMYIKNDLSAAAIAQVLTDMKIPSSGGKDFWFAETVLRLLKNDLMIFIKAMWYMVDMVALRTGKF